MRSVANVFMLMSIFLLMGCGGNGEALGGYGAVYNGKTSKAVLTDENTRAFVKLIDTGDIDMQVGATMHPKVLPLYSKSKIIDFQSIYAKVIDSSSREGAVSGRISVLVEETSANTGKITYSYENFSDIPGSSIDGKIVIEFTVNSSGSVTKSVTEYRSVHIRDQKEDITLDGRVVSIPSDAEIATISNYSVKNNNTNEVVKYENLKATLNSQGQILRYEGRIYHSKYGYVEVETPIPLAYESNGLRKAEGEVIFEGDRSKATIKYAHDNRVRVEIDKNKDEIVDTIQVYQAGEYEKEVPNAAPVIHIDFPREIFTDTNTSQIRVSVYDPDLDGFTTSFEWRINGEVKGNAIALSSALFKKHDRLKLTVVAIDDRPGNARSATAYKEQKVLNSKPVVTASFSKLGLRAGENVELEYSVVDKDGDAIDVSWMHYRDLGLGGEQVSEELCTLAIEEYNIQNPDNPYDSLSDYEKEDFNNTYCKEEILGSAVPYDFVVGKNFQAVAPGKYIHKMIASDGEHNATATFRSDILKSDIIERVINNSNQDVAFNKPHNLYIKDFDNDGHKDLIYIGYVTKQNEGGVIVEPNGETITVDPFEYQVPVLTIEYKQNGTLLKKEQYDLNDSDFDNFYVNDLNGDGKLDILITHTNGYSPPTNKKFSMMLQNGQSALDKKVDFNLSNYKSLAIADITGDGSEDIVLNAIDGWSDAGIQVFHEDGNQTLVLSLPDSLLRKILIADLDANTKQDLIVINKNSSNKNTLDFECSILSQDSNATFTEKTYQITLNTNIQYYEGIVDVILADFNGMKNIFFVLTTKRIYLLHINKDTDTINIIKILEHAEGKKTPMAKVLDPVDINHDGKEDIIVVDTAMYANTLIGVFIQRTDMNFLVEQKYLLKNESVMTSNSSFAFGDLNNDGRYEIFFNTGEENLSAIYFK